MQNKEKRLKRWEALIFIFLFLPLIKISYTHIDESISVIKYSFHWDVGNLLKNYYLFLYSFKSFLFQTLSFHQGTGSAGWNTVYYLLPLFTFVNLIGGLSLRNLYLFTITTSIISLCLFYCWINRFWNREIAFFATFLFGYSAIFQELARSGSYIGFSIMIAIVWIMCMYFCLETKRLFPFLLLGLLTGIAMYGYGMLRSLIFPYAYILISRNVLKNKKCLLFSIIGPILFILPGVILRIERDFQFYKENFLGLFLNEEHIFRKGIFLNELMRNIPIFLNRILGGRQTTAYYVTNNYHAHYLNKALVIPFFTGFFWIIKCRKKRNYKLLLLLSCSIFFIPLFSNSGGYGEDRRALLYVIPVYLFIGIGLVKIFDYLKRVHNKFIKGISLGGIFSIIIFIVFNELGYSKTYILKNNRDLGILKFAGDIKERLINENIYYLESAIQLNDQTMTKTFDFAMCSSISENELRNFSEKYRISLYQRTKESAVLKLALMDRRRNYPQLIEISDIREIDNNFKSFYFAKSPLVSKREFKKMCKKLNLRPKLLIVAPVINFYDINYLKILRDDAFRLYIIIRK